MASRGKPWSVVYTKAYHKAYYLRHKHKQVAENRLKKFGCSSDQYENMVQEQQGLCASCRHPETSKNPRSKTVRSLAVDHNHTTGKIRGLLCMNCNTALGQLKEDPLRITALLAYLERTM